MASRASARGWPARLFAAIEAAPDDAVALESSSDLLTYGRLRRLLRDLAWQTPAGVDGLRGRLVALAACRSPEYVGGLLGLWAAGAIPVVTEESWSEAQRSEAWAQARCALRAEIGGGTAVVRETGGPPAVEEIATAALDGLSHVLFTSGSLGRPTPSYVGATAFDLGIGAYEAVAGIGPGDVVPMLSAPSHDPGLRDVLAPLLGGARVCVPPPEVVASPGRLAGWVGRTGATVLHVVPVRLRLLCHALRSPVGSVRLVVSSGGVLTPQDAALVRRSFPQASLVNGYGLTETPQLVTCRRWPPEELDAAAAGPDLPIGRPLRRCRVEVWPREGEGALPDGRQGEICVAEPHIAETAVPGSGTVGDGAGRGPDGSRFVTDSVGVRWCRTGDLGWVDERGDLHFSGRIGRLQKVNGRLLDLDLVEAAAMSSPDVVVAVARVVRRSDRDLLEVAVRPAGDLTDARAAVRQHLDAAPALRGVPWTLVEGWSVRLSPALKPVYADEAAAPEELLTRILRLAEALVGAPVDEQVSFMDSGFTSEGLLLFAEALGGELGVEVPLLDLFRAPTPLALAAALSAGRPGERPPDGRPPPPPRAHQLERAEAESARRRILRQIRSEESWTTDRTGLRPEGRRTR